MLHVYIDPSAWVKRYYDETGKETINFLFEELFKISPSHLICSKIGITEVISVLNRHRNAGRISKSNFNVGFTYFETESRKTRLLAVKNHQINASIRLLLTHNLNSVDALHLQVALETQSKLYQQDDILLFVSADKRLLRAAHAEGLKTFNPETDNITQLERFFPKN